MSAQETVQRIVEARFDPSVSGEKFVALLRELAPRIKTPRWRRPDRSKIDYDERVRIRIRSEKERDGQQYPPGFIAGLAAEYGVSRQAIYKILNGD